MGVCCAALAAGAAESTDEDSDDASQIAARAVASAMEELAQDETTDLAASAYDAIVRDLLLQIETIQQEHGHVSRQLEAPLFELGKLYVTAEQCQSAIPILRQAILLTRQLDGVLNPRQLPMYEPLLQCYVAKDMVIDVERTQEQMLLIHERTGEKNGVQMLPALKHAGKWYERAGMYEKARNAYQRAMRIAREAGGPTDIRLIEPLRGLARTYRLQVQFEEEEWRGRSLDLQGQRTLEQAARIAREREDADQQLRIDTLLELGDWYQMSGAFRDAVKVYKEVWRIAVDAATPGAVVLGRPEPVLYRAAVGQALRQAPVDRTRLKHYWIDFEFTVTRLGEVNDVVARSTTAPRFLQNEIAQNLKHSRYRPRFVNGEPVDTERVRIRQGVWVEN